MHDAFVNSEPSPQKSLEPDPIWIPKVSIIIAAFNGELFIERAILSAKDQDCTDLEIIIVDDASTDNTCRVVNMHAEADSRIRLVRSHTNKGPAAARNTGIDNARGAWIAILDSDDAFAPKRLAYLINLATEYDCDIIADNFVYYDSKTGTCSSPAMETVPSVENIDLYSFVEHNGVNSADADFGLLKPIFSRAFLARTGLRYPENVRHGEDWELVFAALKRRAHYVLARDRLTYLYTTRDSGFSRTSVDYNSISTRMKKHSKTAAQEGDLLLSKMLLHRVDYINILDLDYMGSMSNYQRPRMRMVFTAMRSRVGWRWLFSRLFARWRSAKGASL